MLVVTQQFGIFNMATFDLVLKVIDAGGSIDPVKISPHMASFSGNSPQICFCDGNPHCMNLNSIAHHGIVLDEEYQDSREQQGKNIYPQQNKLFRI